MKLIEISDRYPQLKDMSLTFIAVKHPDTGKKVYVRSQWVSGIWFVKERGATEGRMYPYTGNGDVGKLEVHPDFYKECGVKKKT